MKPSNSKRVRTREGKWLDTSFFSEEALFYEKHGYYTNETWGSIGWRKYWQTQLDRCINGYKVGHEKITGHHYFYLNFTQLQREVKDPKTNRVKKERGFPYFRDGDYDFFWAFEIAHKGISPKEFKKLKTFIQIPDDQLGGGKNLGVAKKRRSGYTMKAAAIAANTYNTIRNSTVIVGASDNKYLTKGGIMSHTLENLNFLNMATGWRKNREEVKKKDHVKSSYFEIIDGVKVSKGYKSEILAISFNDNEDAARGKEADVILLDEVGSFDNLMSSFLATAPSVKSGGQQFGIILYFGTGSKMERGAVDFEKMFTDPLTYDSLAFNNIWDKDSSHTYCGFFHPAYINKEEYTDSQGNSDIKGALQSEIEIREAKKQGKSSKAFFSHMMEYPIYTTDVFSSTQASIFNVVRLRERLNYVKREDRQLLAEVVTLIEKDGKIKIVVDNKKKLSPLYDRIPKMTDNLDGAVLIYERPIESAPPNSYSIGYDPYAQDKSKGVSIASVIVRKKAIIGSYTKNKIVARYRGRPESADDVNEIFLLLCKLYNSKGMYENMFRHPKTYFANSKSLNYLAMQPDNIITKHIKDSGVQRIYGCHMTDELKDAGETYIKKNLGEVVDYKWIDDERISITVLDQIDDIPLLEDLISYSRKTNHDDVMSYMMCMFQEEEYKINQRDPKEMEDVSRQLLDLARGQYNNNKYYNI